MNQIKLFQNQKVRSVWIEKERCWYFSVADVVQILTDSSDIKQYVKKLRQRDPELSTNWGTICTLLELTASDGKKRKTLCANTENLFRIIQSIPSSKAEPFKRWLAKVGSERLDEIQNPELASKRIRIIYKAKGYSDEWIEKRIRGIAVRDELTNEWKKRGVKEATEYSILTAEISRATFGMTPTEYKYFKSLDNPVDNLRDHMTDLELIFTMLGEASTTEIARQHDAYGFNPNKIAAIQGGTVAGNARKELEKKVKHRIASKDNFKNLTEKAKRQIYKE